MNAFPQIKGQYKFNYNLNHLTWFKVGGPAKIFFKPFDTLDLINFLKSNNDNLPIFIIGAGSNLIIRDGGIEGVVIKLGQNFTNIEIAPENHLKVGAGCLNFNLAKFCQANSIAGFEFLIGIPGTIGGGIATNAGAYGREFKDIVVGIEAINSLGELIKLSSEEIGFKYRSNSLPEELIITKVIFKTTQGSYPLITNLMNEINLKRAATQPIKEKTGGSTFANPKFYKAWELIDRAGLRGYRIGDASISELHCNFMINHGSASAKDLENLGEYVKARVFELSGIKLEWEIKRIGRYV